MFWNKVAKRFQFLLFWVKGRLGLNFSFGLQRQFRIWGRLVIFVGKVSPIPNWYICYTNCIGFEHLSIVVSKLVLGQIFSWSVRVNSRLPVHPEQVFQKASHVNIWIKSTIQHPIYGSWVWFLIQKRRVQKQCVFIFISKPNNSGIFMLQNYLLRKTFFWVVHKWRHVHNG